MKNFKIRCSANGHIVSGSVGITEKQKETIETLESKEKITAKQSETLADLIYKRDNPELPQGVKTYCKNWLKGQLLDYVHEFSSKYTDKGNIMEDESIDFIADQLGYGFLMKNEDPFSNEFMQGTADIVLSDEIIDVKNSWDASTFPMFETEIPNSDYYWQLQGYMCGYDKPKAKLIYTLMDTPEHLIERDARYDSMRQGYEELEMSVYEKVYNNLTYKNIDPKLRIKVFEIERCESDIQLIKDRVVLCRKYIEKLKNSLL